MRKNNEAISLLESVAKLDTLITNKLIEQKQWRDMALGITENMNSERVQSSGKKDKMADAVERCVDMEAEIDRLIDKYIDQKKKVLQVIERLDSPIEYNLLHMRYIQHKSLQDIADHYHREYGWATTTHGRAVSKVQSIMDRKERNG